MNKMLGYIMVNVQSSPDLARDIKKVDKKLATFILVAATYMIAVESHLRKQNKRIEKLSNEVKELKRAEG